MNTPADNNYNQAQSEEMRDTCLEWAAYFALLAKLFAQTAIGFNAVAKFPYTVSPEAVARTHRHMTAVRHDCEGFQSTMGDIGNELDKAIKELGEAVVTQQKSEEPKDPT